MRVALINDGMYPYRSSVGGTWAHRLIRGLPEHAFHLVTITERTATGSVYYPPANALTLTSITLAGRSLGPARRRAALRHRRIATHAAVLMCRSMLEDTPSSLAVFRNAMRRLASGADETTHALHGVPLAAVLLDAWRAAARRSGATTAMRPRAALPEPTAEDAWIAANLLDLAMRPLSTPLPLTELNHAADAGLAALVALGAKWRTRTPYVLTEHETYLDAPLLAHTYRRPGVHAVLLRFFRALARLAHHEAGMTIAPTDALRRWAADHGADRDRLVLAPYGVDPHGCALLRGEPADPNVVWLGPERDLVTLTAALPAMRQAHPGIRVLVAGPAVAVLDRRDDTVIGFLGPVSHHRSAYANGQVVVVCAGHESMPYALIEAMMCGRPTIVVGDAELASVVGLGAVVVPPGDAAALASAVSTLLGDAGRRRALSTAAGQRARSLFALRAQLDRFRDAYERASRDTSSATEPILSTPVPAGPLLADRSHSGSEAEQPPARPPAGGPTDCRSTSLGAMAAKLLAPLPAETSVRATDTTPEGGAPRPATEPAKEPDAEPAKEPDAEPAKEPDAEPASADSTA